MDGQAGSAPITVVIARQPSAEPPTFHQAVAVVPRRPMAPASVPVAGSLAAALVLAVVFGGRRRRLMPDGPLERLLERSLPSREYRLAIRIHRAGIAA